MNMDANLHRNAVLTGVVDSYCLVCESLLRADDATSHIDKPIHKKNLDLAPYVEKYKAEHIRKVKRGYYCEFCNLFITTVPKVGLHICEDTHIENKKKTPSLRRVGNGVVASDNIFINEKAWNGLIDETCAVCNTEFMDEQIHKTDQKHILNLIEKKVFEEANNIYRMVDEESFQCLTCNMIYALKSMSSHFNQEEHKKLLQKCQEFQFPKETKSSVQPTTYDDIMSQGDAAKKPSPKSDKPYANLKCECVSHTTTDQPKEPPKKPADTKKASDSQSTDNTKKASDSQNTANTKKASDSSNTNDGPKYDSKTNVNMFVQVEEAMRTLMKPNFDQNHNEKKEKTKEKKDEAAGNDLAVSVFSPDAALMPYVPPSNSDPSKNADTPNYDIDDPVEFAKEHKLTFNKGNSNAICRICKTRLPGALKSMKEHVLGNSHRQKSAKVKQAKVNIPRKPMHKFVKQRSSVINMFNDDVILNDRLCLTRYSYLMITEQLNRLRCQACEVNLTEDEMGLHLESTSHERAMEETPVVWTLDGEFVREVRPGLFHCGFCNLIVGTWENVPIHLECEDHDENKEFAGNRLREHLPGILSHRRQKEQMFLNYMMGHHMSYMC